MPQPIALDKLTGSGIIDVRESGTDYRGTVKWNTQGPPFAGAEPGGGLSPGGSRRGGIGLTVSDQSPCLSIKSALKLETVIPRHRQFVDAASLDSPSPVDRIPKVLDLDKQLQRMLAAWSTAAEVEEQLGGGNRNSVWAVCIGGRRYAAGLSTRPEPALDWKIDEEGIAVNWHVSSAPRIHEDDLDERGWSRGRVSPTKFTVTDNTRRRYRIVGGTTSYGRHLVQDRLVLAPGIAPDATRLSVTIDGNRFTVDLQAG